MDDGRRPIGIDSENSCGPLFQDPSTEFATGVIWRETAMSDASQSKTGVEIPPRAKYQSAFEHDPTRRDDRKARQW